MEIEKSYKVFGKLNKLREILVDLKYYGKLHPLIKSINKIEDESKEHVEYEIKERPYKWIPITIKYYAEVRLRQDLIEYRIKGIPVTKVTIKYTLTEVDKQAIRIRFRLKIENNFVGKKILENKMINAQDLLMTAIKKELSMQF